MICLGSVLYGCNSNSDNDDTSTTYNGAGSRWELIINNDATCVIKEKDSGINLNADCNALESGFTKVTVHTVTGTTDIAVDDTTYGFELPGFMLPFVAFNEDKLIPTVVGGTCPSSDIQHNVIISYAKGNTAESNFDGWGNFGYWNTDNNRLTVNVYQRDGTLNNQFTTDFTVSDFCDKGETYLEPNMADEEPATTTAYWTDGGGIIWNQASATDDRVENDFMIPVETGLTDLTGGAANGDYLGYKVTGNGQVSIGYSNVAVYASINNGTLTITPVNPETGEATGATGDTVVLSNNINDGLFNGTLTTPAGEEGIGCAFDLNASDSGSNVVMCGGMNPDGSLQQLYSLILVSR